MPDWIRALTLWSDLLAQYGRADVDLPDFEMKPGNITWLDGPDCITVKASDGAARTFPGIFVTVTTEDQAIEIDQIAEIDFPEGCTLLDGEVHSGHLLNRPVGLFNVKRFYEEPKPDTEILPDMMFHTAREVCLDDPPAEPLRPPGPEFAKIYLSRLQLGNSEWGLKENRFGLCPVTASVIRRHRRHLKSA
jgi:hypothetical protein